MRAVKLTPRLGRLTASLGLVMGFGASVAAMSAVELPLGWAGSHPYSPDQTATATPTQTTPCARLWDKVAEPGSVLRGEEVTVTLTWSAVCAGELLPTRYVLVLDESALAAGAPQRNIIDTARNLVRELDVGQQKQVAVVAFSGDARTVCGLSDDKSMVLACIARAGGGDGSGNIAAGIQEGHKALLRGRTAPGDDFASVMVVFAATASPSGCSPVVQAANTVKSGGGTVATICAPDGCDDTCMRQVASRREIHFPEVLAVDRDLLAKLGGSDILAIAPRTLEITDGLPPDVALVTDSARPTSQATLPALRWVFRDPPPEGVTIAYRVTIDQFGDRPVNTGAVASMTDNQGRGAIDAFPLPIVHVYEAGTQATPDPRTPGPGGSATPTTTATGVSSPTATDPSRPTQAFLPIANPQSTR